jgi:hypothetical protein
MSSMHTAGLTEREVEVLRLIAAGKSNREIAVADAILDGRARLGGARLDRGDRVPDGFLAGQRRPPAGRPPGRRKGAKDTPPRTPRPTA